MKKISLSPQYLALLILVCFFLSGATGLIYEVLWTRMIIKIIGGAPFAVSIILTIFMGGLGLGSYLAGRTVDRVSRPEELVRLYGLLELIIGAYGLVLPFLIAIFRPLFAQIYNGVFEYGMIYSILTFVGCAILLIIPVTCMGATLPVLSRFYVSNLGHLGTHTGRLYGLNTIGAGFGALAAGFWLLAAFGLWGTLTIAIVLNAAIGLVCVIVGRRTRVPKPRPTPKTAPAEKPISEAAAYPRAIVYAALIVFAVSGFCSMSYEVIWTKLLGLMVGPTTYSFTIVLVTFIIGLALGAMLFGWLADRTRRPVSLLLITQVAAAIFALGVSQVLGNSQLFFAKLVATFYESFTALSVAKAAFLFLFMLPPTLCLGATFPLVGKIFTPSTTRVGRSIGFAYAINTIGAVLGSFIAGFVIIPAFGKANGLSMVVILQLLGALAFGFIILRTHMQRLRSWAPAVGVAILALVAATVYPQWDRNLLSLGRYHRFAEHGLNPAEISWTSALLRGPEILAPKFKAEVVYFGDGVAGTTTVLKTVDALNNIELSMTNAGKPDASTRGDMATQTLLAHFPLLFGNEVQDVMVLGLASGITAGEILRYPVRRLDVVEISREVAKASDYFRPWNHNVLDDPRTRLIIQDGRAHLGMTDTKYDVISSEPSNPWMAGLATLFTWDLFTYARDALRDDGMFVQFIHTYQMDWPTFALIGRSFVDVFPNSMLVSASPDKASNDLLLVGIKGDASLNLERARQLASITRRPGNFTVDDPLVLLRLIRAQNLRELFGDGPLNTDSRPLLEFTAPKLMYHTDPQIPAIIVSRGRLTEPLSHVIAILTEKPESQIDFMQYELSVHLPMHGYVPPIFDYERATPGQIMRYDSLVCSYCSENPTPLSLYQDERTRETCADCQQRALQALIDSGQGTELTYGYLATLYRQNDQLDHALATYTAWAKDDPTDPRAAFGMGEMLLARDDLQKALIAFLAADRLEPGNPNTLTKIGFLYGRIGRYDLARDFFLRAIQNDTSFAHAHAGLGTVEAAVGNVPAAIEQYRKALRLDPSLEYAKTALARLQAAS